MYCRILSELRFLILTSTFFASMAGLKTRFNSCWTDTRCPARHPPCFHSSHPVCLVNPVLAEHYIHCSGFPYFELPPTFLLSSTSRHLQLLQSRRRQLQSLHPSTSATAIQPIGERRCSFFSRSYCPFKFYI